VSSRQPFLPQFRAQLAAYGLRRTLQSTASLTLSGLEALAGPALPNVDLGSAPFGDNSRNRIYTLKRTFWCFLWQLLQPKTSGRGVVRQLQALLGLQDHAKISSSDGAYFAARARLPLALLKSALSDSARSADQRAGNLTFPGLDREVLAVDGSTTSSADTAASQRRFPQSASQAKGCGFPLIKFVVLFSLASGAIRNVAIGNKHVHELRLFRRIWKTIKAGAILVADRAFSDYVTLAELSSRGIDVVTRLHQGRDPDGRRGKRIGPGERLRVFTQPVQRPKSLAKRIWNKLAPELTVRLITVKVNRKGFRPGVITLMTTLLDVEKYPRPMIEGLYLRRWKLELCLRDIKTTLGMEVLRAKSPEMVEKEIYGYLIGHNLIRWIMADAAREHSVDLTRISFKGTVDAVRPYSAALAVAGTRNRRRKLYESLLETLAEDLVPDRPDRREPRAVKRRPKPFAQLNKPRRQYREVDRRNKGRKKRD
jgi:hypothetical protein